jgi:hypothetical protein
MIIKSLIACCVLAAPFQASAADPVQEGMTVVRDPQSGKLRAPTSAELRALRRDIMEEQMMAPPPKSSVRPDGTRSIDLGERGMVYSVMQRNADGTLSTRCVKGEQAAAEAIEENQHEHP